MDVSLKVGKPFQFLDPHTTHAGNTWTWHGETEVVKQAALVDVPVTVECNQFVVEPLGNAAAVAELESAGD